MTKPAITSNFVGNDGGGGCGGAPLPSPTIAVPMLAAVAVHALVAVVVAVVAVVTVASSPCRRCHQQ
jgi:hypothetical protein